MGIQIQLYNMNEITYPCRNPYTVSPDIYIVKRYLSALAHQKWYCKQRAFGDTVYPTNDAHSFDLLYLIMAILKCFRDLFHTFVDTLRGWLLTLRQLQ